MRSTTAARNQSPLEFELDFAESIDRWLMGQSEFVEDVEDKLMTGR